MTSGKQNDRAMEDQPSKLSNAVGQWTWSNVKWSQLHSAQSIAMSDYQLPVFGHWSKRDEDGLPHCPLPLAHFLPIAVVATLAFVGQWSNGHVEGEGGK